MCNKDEEMWDSSYCAACGRDECYGDCPFYAAWERNFIDYIGGWPTRPLPEMGADACYHCHDLKCDGLCQERKNGTRKRLKGTP